MSSNVERFVTKADTRSVLLMAVLQITYLNNVVMPDEDNAEDDSIESGSGADEDDDEDEADEDEGE